MSRQLFFFICSGLIIRLIGFPGQSTYTGISAHHTLCPCTDTSMSHTLSHSTPSGARWTAVGGEECSHRPFDSSMLMTCVCRDWHTGWRWPSNIAAKASRDRFATPIRSLQVLRYAVTASLLLCLTYLSVSPVYMIRHRNGYMALGSRR